jgi:hypothetical protein
MRRGRSTPPRGASRPRFLRPTSPTRGLTSGDTASGRRGGTRVAGVGISVEIRVGISVGVPGPQPPLSGGWTGRAAELASEAARAEGASLTCHRPWPARRGPGQAVKGEWLRRWTCAAAGCRTFALDCRASRPASTTSLPASATRALRTVGDSHGRRRGGRNVTATRADRAGSVADGS